MLTLELPVHEKQRGYNLRRWAELLADRELARIEGRIETAHPSPNELALDIVLTSMHG